MPVITILILNLINCLQSLTYINIKLNIFITMMKISHQFNNV